MKGQQLPSQSPTVELPSAIVVALCAVAAGLGHLGRMLYENKPIPLRKAVGGQILTLCVGTATGSLVQAYLNPDPLIVLPSCLLVGYIGGPTVLALAARWAKAEADHRIAGRKAKNETEEEKSE